MMRIAKILSPAVALALILSITGVSVTDSVCLMKHSKKLECPGNAQSSTSNQASLQAVSCCQSTHTFFKLDVNAIAKSAVHSVVIFPNISVFTLTETFGKAHIPLLSLNRGAPPTHSAPLPLLIQENTLLRI
jgi:hypothetical protein